MGKRDNRRKRKERQQKHEQAQAAGVAKSVDRPRVNARLSEAELQMLQFQRR